MIQLTNITSSPKQLITILLENGEEAQLELMFIPQQNGWFFNLIYNNTNFNGGRLVLHPNILFKYKNILPFGIGLYDNEQIDPVFQDDFSIQRVIVIVYTKEEIDEINKIFFIKDE